MKKIKSLLTIAGACGLTALALQYGSVARAVTINVAPSNLSITNLITGATNVLWDVSLLTNELRTLDLNLHTGSNSTVEVIWDDPFTQNGHGKLAGSGTNAEVTVIRSDSGSSKTNTFTGKYVSSGSITSAKGVAHLTFNARVSGTVLLSGDTKPREVTASANFTAKFDALSNSVSGHFSEHASAAGKGSASKSGALDAGPLSSLSPELGDGTWTLTIHFGAATGDKLTGTATVTLNSGAVYPFTFTGIFNPKTNESKLNLKGVDAGLGSSLQVALDGTDITKITGQVSGQLVNIK